MIPYSLRMKNFFSHEDSYILFDELNSISMILGSLEGNMRKSNGAGKTTIIEAILFSLYEKTRLSESKSNTLNDVVRWNSNGKMELDYQFYLDDQRATLYRILRTRDIVKDKGTASFDKLVNGKWISLSEDKKANTNKEIIKKIGIDYDTFCAAIIFQQKEIDKFVSSSDTERKAIFKNILQLDRYDQYALAAKAEVATIDSQIKAIDAIISSSNINFADIEIKQNQLSSLSKTIHVLQIEQDSILSQIQKLRHQQIGYNEQFEKRSSLIKQLTSKTDFSTRLTSQINLTKKKLEDYKVLFEKRKEDYQQVSNQYETIRDRFVVSKQDIMKEGKTADGLVKEAQAHLDETNLELGKLEGQLQELKANGDRVKTLAEAECPTCFACITPQTKNSAIELLLAKEKVILVKIENLRKKSVEAKKQLALAVDKLEKAKELLQEYSSWIKEKLACEEKFNILKSSLEETKLVVEDQKNLQAESLSLLEQTSAEIVILQKEIDSIVIDQAAFEQLNGKIKEKDDKLEINKRMLMDSQLQKGRIQNEIQQLEDRLAQIKKSREEKEQLQKERFYFDQGSKILGKEIPTLIVENACLDVSKEANKILGATSSDTIQFVTQRPNKDGTMKEAFEIEILRPGVAKPILMDSLSNGQKFRIVFAIRIALSRLLSRRRSSPAIKFLFYDECFASLDEQGVDDIIDLFKYLRSEFAHQIIITHGTNLKDRFSDSIINVDQDRHGVSKLKYKKRRLHE